MKKILGYFGRHLGVVVFSLLVSFVVAGVIYAATTIYNNFYGQTTINQSAQEQSDGSLGGNLDATGGIQNASDPVTTLSNVDVYDLDVTNRLAVDGTTTLTGTTTVTKSYDGFVAWDNFTLATGTAKAVYTNSTGVDMMCNRGAGDVYFNATGFAPSIVFGIGESSSATGFDVSLIASTTVATSTDTITAFTSVVPFVLESGNSIVASLSDYVAAIASSTHFGNWTAEFSIDCHLIGQ